MHHVYFFLEFKYIMWLRSAKKFAVFNTTFNLYPDSHLVLSDVIFSDVIYSLDVKFTYKRLFVVNSPRRENTSLW